MMIVRKVIEYIYEKYILNEQQQQQQQQNPPMTTAGNGSSKNFFSQEMKYRNEILLLDQHDGSGEQQRESDISKSVDHIELLCQDQVRTKLFCFSISKNFIYRFWIYQWIYELLNILCGKEVVISFYVFVLNLNFFFDWIIILIFCIFHFIILNSFCLN